MVITVVTGDDSSEAETPLLDDVVRGSVDFNGLPSTRSRSGCWKSASFIMGVEVAERFAYYGLSSNLITYLTGPLGRSTATAATDVNAWTGTSLIMTLVGGFVADTFLGRYRTIVIASLLYILGFGFLSLSAAFHSDCKADGKNLSCSPSPFEVIAAFVSLYILASAQGGHKPCLEAFGADQFDDEDKRECKAKSSFFNWWYFAVNGGGLVAPLVLSYIQENLSWELGFGIPCISMCFALMVFLLGTMTYRFRIKSDKRSSFLRISQVFVKAARNWTAASTVIEGDERKILPHECTQFKFLDKAILAHDRSGEDRNICSIGDIDAKAILRLVPIWWCPCLGYAIVYAQTLTLFTKQGATMDRSIAYGFQIPAASLQSLISLSIMVFIPIYDRVFVPIARAITKKPAGISMLQRIGTGLILSLLCMVTAALVERKRLVTVFEHDLVDEPRATVPMSVWWLAPQYLLYGVSEVFTIIGLQEFFYDQIPSELKSVGIALYLSIFGIGNFLSSLLISIIEKATTRDGQDSWFPNNLNRAHIDYFYWLLSGLSAVAMTAYVYFAKSYIYREMSRYDVITLRKD